MKQGSGRTTNSGRMMQPMGRSYTPGVVSQIGEALGNHSTDSTRRLDPHAPMYQGREGHSPKTGTTIHHGGSQGRHE